jgi:hypothetical protein
MPAASRHSETDSLLERATWGEQEARAELLRGHRLSLLIVGGLGRPMASEFSTREGIGRESQIG